MLDAGLKQTAQDYITQLGVPVIRVIDVDKSGSDYKVSPDSKFHVPMMLGLINPVVANVVDPFDKVVRLMLPEMVDEFTYAVNMHELGHTLGRTTVETQAWQWAYDHSSKWTRRMQDAVAFGLSSYVKGEYLSQHQMDTFMATLKDK